MNPDYPATIRWGTWILQQTETTSQNQVAHYQGGFDQDVVLWVWKSKQWGAKVDDASYSVADSYEEALREAALRACEYHDYRLRALRDMLDEGEP